MRKPSPVAEDREDRPAASSVSPQLPARFGSVPPHNSRTHKTTAQQALVCIAIAFKFQLPRSPTHIAPTRDQAIWEEGQRSHKAHGRSWAWLYRGVLPKPATSLRLSRRTARQQGPQSSSSSSSKRPQHQQQQQHKRQRSRPVRPSTSPCTHS